MNAMNPIKSVALHLASATRAVACFSLLMPLAMIAQENRPVIRIQADQVKAHMPPAFYGLMTEEINYSYEGGLYGELIRNRTFKSDSLPQHLRPEDYHPATYYPATYPAGIAPKFWTGVGDAALLLDNNTPLNETLISALPSSGGFLTSQRSSSP